MESQLLLAVRNGDVTSLNDIFTKTVNLDYQDKKNGWTALHYAIENGRDAVVELLLLKGARTDIADFELEDTAIHTAAACGNLAGLKLLVQHGANIRSRNKNGTNLLMRAVQGGHSDMMEYLLTMKVDIDEQRQDGMTALCLAQKGRFSVVEMLLKSGADPNITTATGETALSIAVSRGWVAAVRLLLDSGADIYVADQNRMTPLMKASQAGLVDIVEMLVDHYTLSKTPNTGHLDALNKDGDSALKLAVVQHHETIIEYLIMKGTNVESVDQKGAGALYHAVQYDHLPCVVQLIAGGANVNAVTGELAKSVLQTAALCGHSEIVRYLIDNGASADYTDKEGSAALAVAVRAGHFGIVELLIDRGACITNCTTSGRSLLMEASACGHLSIVELLLDEGLNANEFNVVDGRTALHYAAEHDHAEVVKTLLKQGNVNPHTINNLGKTAREAATNPKLKALLPNAPGTWVGAWDNWWWQKTNSSIDLAVLKRQHARWMRHAAGAAERVEWLNIRDELEGLKKSAVEAREYKLVTNLQHQLQSHNLTSNCQLLSIRHFNSLRPRRNELLALLENKRAELSVSKHVLELQEISRLSRALTEVDIFENLAQVVATPLSLSPVRSTAELGSRSVSPKSPDSMSASPKTPPTPITPPTPVEPPVPPAADWRQNLWSAWQSSVRIATPYFIRIRDTVIKQPVAAEPMGITNIEDEGYTIETNAGTMRLESGASITTFVPQSSMIVTHSGPADQAPLQVFTTPKQTPDASPVTPRKDEDIKTRLKLAYEEYAEIKRAHKVGQYPEERRGSAPAILHTHPKEPSGHFDDTFEVCCPLCPEVTAVAAFKGHLTCLQSGLQHTPIPHETACAAAFKGGHVDCLQLLRQHNAAWDRDSLMLSIEYGHVATLKYAMENGCDQHENDALVRAAAEAGHVSCLRYLIGDLSLTMNTDGSLFGTVFERLHLDCVMYLIDEGCPFVMYRFGGQDKWGRYRACHDIIVDADKKFLMCIKWAVDKSWGYRPVYEGIADPPTDPVDSVEGERWIDRNLVNFISHYREFYPLCNAHIVNEKWRFATIV